MTKAIEKSVGRALLVTARLHRSRMGERLNGLGLFPGQEQALKALQPAPMTMGELAALLRVKPPTVSKTIGRLSLQGLVTREGGNRDGRLVQVALNLVMTLCDDPAETRQSHLRHEPVEESERQRQPEQL